MDRATDDTDDPAARGCARGLPVRRSASLACRGPPARLRRCDTGLSSLSDDGPLELRGMHCSAYRTIVQSPG